MSSLQRRASFKTGGLPVAAEGALRFAAHVGSQIRANSHDAGDAAGAGLASQTALLRGCSADAHRSRIVSLVAGLQEHRKHFAQCAAHRQASASTGTNLPHSSKRRRLDPGNTLSVATRTSPAEESGGATAMSAAAAAKALTRTPGSRSKDKGEKDQASAASTQDRQGTQHDAEGGLAASAPQPLSDDMKVCMAVPNQPMNICISVHPMMVR